MEVNSNFHPWVLLESAMEKGGCATFVNLLGDHTTRKMLLAVFEIVLAASFFCW